MHYQGCATTQMKSLRRHNRPEATEHFLLHRSQDLRMKAYGLTL